MEECRVNPGLLKCLKEDCETLGPSTPIYTDPAMVHVTLDHAFGRSRIKLTKDHQNMGLEAWVTANQLTGQRPFGVPLTEKQMKKPPRQPPTPPTALLKRSAIIWEQHVIVELHTDSGKRMLLFCSNPAPDGWNIPVSEGKQRGRPPVTSAPPPVLTSAPAQPDESPSASPASPLAAAQNWSDTFVAALAAWLQENATKQHR